MSRGGKIREQGETWKGIITTENGGNMIDGRDKMEADIAVELKLLDRLTTQEIENVSEISHKLGIAQDRQHRFKKRTEALWRLQDGLNAFKVALNSIGEK